MGEGPNFGRPSVAWGLANYFDSTEKGISPEAIGLGWCCQTTSYPAVQALAKEGMYLHWALNLWKRAN